MVGEDGGGDKLVEDGVVVSGVAGDLLGEVFVGGAAENVAGLGVREIEEAREGIEGVVAGVERCAGGSLRKPFSLEEGVHGGVPAGAGGGAAMPVGLIIVLRVNLLEDGDEVEETRAVHGKTPVGWRLVDLRDVELEEGGVPHEGVEGSVLRVGRSGNDDVLIVVASFADLGDHRDRQVPDDGGLGGQVVEMLPEEGGVDSVNAAVVADELLHRRMPRDEDGQGGQRRSPRMEERSASRVENSSRNALSRARFSFRAAARTADSNGSVGALVLGAVTRRYSACSAELVGGNRAQASRGETPLRIAYWRSSWREEGLIGRA